ncbi:ion transporter [Chryseobacterium sp. R2A-55]|uniref:ion transporter n=1 Tax=Chryseobacterium sp. R2A-55 TaxID=2744445 RepID=UPI001F1F654A|nr:ion transporter [Chryseobacterium sp. R2A-55]
MQKEHTYLPEKVRWKRKVYRIIFKSDTKMGRLFDIILLLLIVISTFIVMMESVKVYDAKLHKIFIVLEIFISIVFTVEYLLRIITIRNKREYIFSFFGIIDLLAIVPFYLSLFFPITKYFLILRMLQMLRIFRILNLMDFMNDGYLIVNAMRKSSRKIYIFLLFLMIFSVISGSIVFMIEGGRPGFESIPQSIYWAVVTVTTVGYGDVAPHTPLGKLFSIIMMISGYAIIATGIVTNEMRNKSGIRMASCNRCGNSHNDSDARFCKTCGEKLPMDDLPETASGSKP